MRSLVLSDKDEKQYTIISGCDPPPPHPPMFLASLLGLQFSRLCLCMTVMGEVEGGDLFYGAQLAGRTMAGPVSLALKLFKEFLLKNRLLSAAFAHAI